jgi:hypothetical protein
MLKQIAIILALCTLSVHAAETPPSDASIKELLAVTQAQKLVESMLPQMDAMMQNAMQNALKSREVSPEAQKLLEKARADAMATMKEELAWSKLEPLYIRVYQKSLNQEEVNGMLAFYKSPTGQAMITKMPVILQNTMAEMQTMMAPTMQKLQKSQQDLVAQIEIQSKPKK